MKKSLYTKKIWGLKDYSIDDIVSNYVKAEKTYGLYSKSAPKIMPKIQLPNAPMSICDEPKEEKKTVVKREKHLAKKYEFLIHTIIKRVLNNDNGMAYLHSPILQNVFGKDYRKMLDNLCKMCILYSDGYYVLTDKAYGYYFSPNVRFTYTLRPSNYLSDYEAKLNKCLSEYQSKEEKNNKHRLDNDYLYYNYNDSLKYLKLQYVNEAVDFVTSHIFPSDKSNDYYVRVIDRYMDGDFHITSIDDNKRIYSIATSTPRLLKPFLNIKYSLDVHNSHPLLFNSILMSYYNIPTSLMDKIYPIYEQIYTSNVESHNVRRFLRKILITNNIEEENIKSIPIDVLYYMYLTSMGLFWDVTIPKEMVDEKNLLRSDIKVLMFREVFYSKKLTARGKEYAKIFAKDFPNVYTVVLDSKRENRTKLANDMMKIESELFGKILVGLYAKKFKVISIHDAIVVLDVKQNEKCTEEIVKEVMTDVYRKYGLHPNISVDYYGKECMENLMKKNMLLKELITDYVSQLKGLAEEGDEDATTTLKKIGNGNYDFYLDTDNQLKLHPLHI